jgi:hypothetical protein
MQNTAPGASFVRSTVFGNQSRAKTLFELIGRRCGLADAAHTAPHVYELLATPQTVETLQRAIARGDSYQQSMSEGVLESFLTELYRRDLIELSPDS